MQLKKGETYAVKFLDEIVEGTIERIFKVKEEVQITWMQPRFVTPTVETATSFAERIEKAKHLANAVELDEVTV